MSFTVPTALATASDLAAWTGQTAPSNATQLLRAATSLVLENVTALYDTDDDGVATDTNIKQAMNDAVCIQAAAWSAIGYDPLTGGVLNVKTAASKSIGSGQITYANANVTAQAQQDAYTGLVPEAVRVLGQQNLLDTHIWTY